MSDGISLVGKTVVVTGAGRGIGRAIAMLMAKHGAQVVVNDVGTSLEGAGSDNTPAQQVANEINAAGGAAVANNDSVAGFASANKIIQCVLDHFGRIDCVVNNAGILRDAIFHKMTEDDWDAVISVMLKGSFNMSRNAAEHFRKQNGGAFVHMTSTSGLIGAMGQANYSAAKLGIVALSKSIAVDMARFNVRSNCVAPVAWTRMTASIPSKDPAAAARTERYRQITAEHNAPLVVFLTSDAAAGVNGQIFSVRKNEIFLMGQSRPLQRVYRAEGWTPEDCAVHMVPAFKDAFYPATERTNDVFSADPS